MSTNETGRSAYPPTPCPICATLRDVSGRASGDVAWCHGCGTWLVLRFDGLGGARLELCDPPVPWPSATRTEPRADE